ncbi:MAG: tRNA-dihydrouridine synthase family protein [Planctomycetaceae bacterium]|nr:tRNA-dihydrouridine synthase family protein [Planctomycetaceae bacterium]
MLHFGPLSIAFPAIQAALSGYSDAPMRRINRKLGAEFTLCEVLLDQFVVAVSRRKAKLYMHLEEDEHPVGAQLMGSEPETFVSAALKLVDAGFDLIDLNFACPVKKVLGRSRGGYLMSDPQNAAKIVQRVRQALPDSIPLTIKLRKGFDDSEESVRKFHEITDRSLDLGIAGITLHGRTVKQRYTGLSDWNFVREVKERLVARNWGHVPLVGSGDLFTAETCLSRMRETGVDGIALARGIIGNPWLFREVRALMESKPLPAPPTIREQRDILEEHYRLAEELYGVKRAGTTMRGFGIRYSQLHPQAETVREAFVRQPWNTVLKIWYNGG